MLLAAVAGCLFLETEGHQWQAVLIIAENVEVPCSPVRSFLRLLVHSFSMQLQSSGILFLQGCQRSALPHGTMTSGSTAKEIARR